MNGKNLMKKPDMYKLDTPERSEYPAMLAVWESSVKATHHFLRNNDIEVLKEIIQKQEVFNQMNLICARDTYNTILGIMGVSEENLEML
jgi:putative acetyltransferase